MKVTTKETNGFKPFTLCIDIETEGEAEVLTELFSRDFSVPTFVYKNAEQKREQLSSVMTELHKTIVNHETN